MRKFICLTLAFCLHASGVAVVRAESPEERPIKVDHLKIAKSMLSDAQNWTDFQILGEYRLQNRTGTDVWRLLGPAQKVQIKSTREACEARLGRLVAPRKPEALDGEVIVLVHGLFQTRVKMESLQSHLKHSGYAHVLNFGYASTKADIAAHSAALRETLQCVKPNARVSFVGHSMGCIVVRDLLANREDLEWKTGRVVMLGPPNQGAEMARRFSRYPLVCSLLGPGFEQLADPRLDALSQLRTPPCEFAVIAGGSPKWLLNNPLIDGDDDWVVGIRETTLPGAKAQACVSSHHGEMVHAPEVLALTTEFLQRGEFTAKPAREGK